jgi:hypothetical protein
MVQFLFGSEDIDPDDMDEENFIEFSTVSVYKSGSTTYHIVISKVCICYPSNSEHRIK